MSALLIQLPNALFWMCFLDENIKLCYGGSNKQKNNIQKKKRN